MSAALVPVLAATKPKFGMVVGARVWIGGAPPANWSDTSSIAPLTPYCWRSNDLISQMKVYGKRTDRQNIKFKHDDPNYSLLSFATDALNHKEAHGMDTLFYMEEVWLSGVAQDLFQYHARYTKSHVDAFVQECLGTVPPTASKIGPSPVDQHRNECLQDSGIWLLNSLDESLKANLPPLLHTSLTGPQAWMAIVNKVQMESMIRVQELMRQFENMTMEQFKEENISNYCTAATNLLLELEHQDQLPAMHLMIIKNFSAVLVQNFVVMWKSQKRRVDNSVRKLAGKDPMVVRQMPNYIHFSHLLDQAKINYHDLQAEWGSSIAGNKLKAMQAKLDSMTSQLSKVKQQLSLSKSKKEGTNDDASASGVAVLTTSPTAQHAPSSSPRLMARTMVVPTLAVARAVAMASGSPLPLVSPLQRPSMVGSCTTAPSATMGKASRIFTPLRRTKGLLTLLLVPLHYLLLPTLPPCVTWTLPSGWSESLAGL